MPEGRLVHLGRRGCVEKKMSQVDLEGPVGQEHQARVSISRGSSIWGPFCLGLTLLCSAKLPLALKWELHLGIQ